MPHADTSDVEKIGMVFGGERTRKYELMTLPSGKVEPVQVSVGPQESLDLQPDSQVSSLYPNGHNECAFPLTGRSDDGATCLVLEATKDFGIPGEKAFFCSR